jgi:hypothetical protein
MAIDYTTVGLLASIRRRASIPTTSTTGSADADLLAYVNEELQLHMTAQLVEVREEYYLRHSDTLLTSGPVFRIPERAIAGALRNVQLLDSASKPVFQLSRLSQEKLPEYSRSSQTIGYLVEGNNIRLYPSASWGGATYVRLSYFERPSEVVAVGNGARAIQVINTGTNQVTISSTTGFTTATKVDFIRATPGFETISIDATPTGVLSTVLTFSSLPSGLAVGDYVSLAKTSPVPQLPAEFYPILAQRVAVRFLAAINDTAQLYVARGELVRMEAAVGILTSPRVEGGPRKIFQMNGALAGNRWRFRNGIGVL